MLELTTPRGLPVSVPESAAEDPSPRFTIGQDSEIVSYYEENGYVIVRGLIGAETCDEMRAIWDSEVKPSKAFLYRQRSSRPERHDIGESGFVMNAVANLQSVDPRSFGRLRDFGTRRILTDPNLIAVFRALIKGKPKLVNSMYFEGNEGSLDHRDGYYFESETLGAMAAAWVALEDIHAGAGRFFISPRSHLFAFPESADDPNLLLEHDVYIKDVLAGLRAGGYEYRAPGLEKGDVLFWHGWTVHGSLAPHDPAHSRSSITVHAIPEPDRFRIRKVEDVPTSEVNGIRIYRRKDQASRRNRAVKWAEATFPGPLSWLKSVAVRLAAARRERRAARRRSGRSSPE